MSAPMDEQRLAEILARADAATKGPWCTDSWEIYQDTEYTPGLSEWIGETCRGVVGGLNQDRANAAFVAAARTDVPDLIAEVQRLRARVAELEGAAICPSIARLHGSKCVLPVRHRGDHRNESKRHYWSDDYAVPRQRQPEDPHDSVLHHDYALGRDLPTIPRQSTGRCPQGHTFEDCTCGGTA
ncbi:hypothetical protein [Streptomyces sp. NPDC058758]|uniref:hypothetical protein n=1 Tax=Streptomyces sp. NPDC058758 TaxID=3346627 RepID=UPI0036B0C3B3